MFALSANYLGTVKPCTYICYVDMRQNAGGPKAGGRGDFVPDADGNYEQKFAGLYL
ncbi:hypothetical protein [Microcoleus sp. herbarium14]|uniref:hypothetical protein n=1 Tax=Microcoleus sp. herbarium14 TaxID=3055439 RepID=UPI002FD1BF4E